MRYILGKEIFMKKQREQYLDFLKGVSVLGVVLVHYHQYWQGRLLSWVSEISNSGQFFVQVFLVISGYLSFSSIKDNSVGFLSRKLVRMIPACYIGYLGTMIIQFLQGGG